MLFSLRNLTMASLVVAGLFVAAPLVQAGPMPFAPTVQRVTPNFQRTVPSGLRGMPGSDWWRTYPWSPYNYFNPNNPYSPYYNRYPNPYPYYPYNVYPVTVYSNYGATYVPSYNQGMYSQNMPYAPTESAETATTKQVKLPNPTGTLRVAPPDAGAIQIKLPDAFGTVLFDGEKVTSTGITRWYTTPTLTAGKAYTSEVTAVFDRGGMKVTEQRKVNVVAGQIQVLDFTSPLAK